MNDYNHYGNDTTYKALLDIGPWIFGISGVMLFLLWLFS